jgi:hypothetical protein
VELVEAEPPGLKGFGGGANKFVGSGGATDELDSIGGGKIGFLAAGSKGFPKEGILCKVDLSELLCGAKTGGAIGLGSSGALPIGVVEGVKLGVVGAPGAENNGETGADGFVTGVGGCPIGEVAAGVKLASIGGTGKTGFVIGTGGAAGGGGNFGAGGATGGGGNFDESALGLDMLGGITGDVGDVGETGFVIGTGGAEIAGETIGAAGTAGAAGNGAGGAVTGGGGNFGAIGGGGNFDAPALGVPGSFEIPGGAIGGGGSGEGFAGKDTTPSVFPSLFVGSATEFSLGNLNSAGFGVFACGGKATAGFGGKATTPDLLSLTPSWVGLGVFISGIPKLRGESETFGLGKTGETGILGSFNGVGTNSMFISGSASDLGSTMGSTLKSNTGVIAGKSVFVSA